MLGPLLRRLLQRPAPRRPGLAAGMEHLEKGDLRLAQAAAASLAGDPQSLPEAHFLEAWIAQRQGDLDRAQQCIALAIEARPGEAAFWLKAAELDFAGGRFVSSGQWYARLLEQQDAPYRKDARIWFAAAGAFEKQGNAARAIAMLEEALAMAPEFVEARSNLASLLALQGSGEAAREHMQRVLRSAPSPAARLRRALMFPLIYASQEDISQRRAGFERELDELLAEPAFTLTEPEVEVGLTAFLLAYQGGNDAPLLGKLGRLVRRSYPGASRECHRGGSGTKIRVGFVSSNFYSHSVSRTTHGFVHDLPREEFEVQVFSIAPRPDAWAAAMRASADRYVELPAQLQTVRAALEAAKLDVLIFADIGMSSLTYYLAYWRLAPLQMNTWGHSVTSGIDSIDHYISGASVEGPGSDAHYSEALLRLPGYFMPRYQRPVLDERRRTRAELGLDEQAHLYYCPQSPFKLHPDFDAALRGILERDPQARILLLSSDLASGPLKQRFSGTLGADAARVSLLSGMPHEQFLQLIAAADVIIDPFHFGGCNSSCEALSLGTPVVALPGPYLRARFTLGLYREMGMEDCIAHSTDDYVSRAVRLATDRELRIHTGEQIRQRAGVLFDRADAGRALGAELQRMASTVF